MLDFPLLLCLPLPPLPPHTPLTSFLVTSALPWCPLRNRSLWVTGHSPFPHLTKLCSPQIAPAPRMASAQAPLQCRTDLPGLTHGFLTNYLKKKQPTWNTM